MRDFGSTFPCSRWLVPALLGGLSLLSVAGGCSRSRDRGGAASPSSAGPAQEVVAQPLSSDSAALESVAAPVTPPRPDAPRAARHRAEFMGAVAVGQRFCIIADASDSMRGGPLRQVKKEILQTLDGLEPGSEFYIVFFNATDVPMSDPGWLAAGQENVNKVRPWVENMSTEFGTRPQSAFDRAFQLQPKPDVIFFMTDGFLGGKDPVAHVHTLNADEPKVTVHTIMFSKAKSSKAKSTIAKATAQLRAIAENNGGDFRHVTQE